MAATYDDGFEYRHTAPRAAPLQQQQAFLPPPIPTEFAPLPFDNSPMPDSRNTRHSSYGMPSSRDSGYGAGYNGFLSASQQQDISSPHAGNSSRRHSTLRSDVTKGPIRRFFAAYKTRNQLIFLSLVLAQSVVLLTMIGLLYGTVNDGIGDLSFSDTFERAPMLLSVATYMSLFILACIFELLVSLDALQVKNILSLCFLLAFQISIVVYASFLPSQLVAAIRGSSADTEEVRDNVRTYSIVIPSVVAGFSLVMGWLVWRLYEEFGWNLYKSLGADLQTKRRYATLQAFMCVVKFDFFLFIGFCIQFLVLVTGTPTVEFALTIAALPIILIVLILGVIFVRREFKAGTYVFLVFQLAGMAYFVYKLVRIYDDSSASRYSAATKTLTFFAVVSLVFLIATFVLTSFCMQNFDQGLRERIPPYRWAAARKTAPAASGEKTTSAGTKLNGAPLEPRMSLD